MEYQIKNIFTEKSCKKCVAKASLSDLFITLVNDPRQSLHARNYFKRYFERGLSKSFKRGLELVTSQYSGYKISPEKFLYYLGSIDKKFSSCLADFGH